MREELQDKLRDGSIARFADEALNKGPTLLSEVNRVGESFRLKIDEGQWEPRSQLFVAQVSIPPGYDALFESFDLFWVALFQFMRFMSFQNLS